MNRREFLSGLLGTTAVVSAAAALPAITFAPLNKVHETAEGWGWYDEWKPGTAFRLKVMATNTGPAVYSGHTVARPIYKNGHAAGPGDLVAGQIIRRVGNDWYA